MIASIQNVKPNLKKQIIVHVNKNSENAYKALENLGYTMLKESGYYGGHFYKVFKKGEKEYVYREMDCSNNYIYNIVISPIEEIY
jgi:hypothetical protein